MYTTNFGIGHGNIIACLWDFDKTLTPDYTQKTLFDERGLDLEKFWREVNSLTEAYAQHGIRVNNDDAWLGHFLMYVKCGLLAGVTNKKLHESGRNVQFFPGIPEIFSKLSNFVAENYDQSGITLEHYVISSGIAEVIRGSTVADYVDGIYACEFIEDPILPGFDGDLEQVKVDNTNVLHEISQVGYIVDNTAKTRCIFEINKGCNRDPKILLNATMDDASRRIPLKNMIYIADGASDIPAFGIVRRGGGLAYAVYNPESDAEFEQNDRMLADGRVDAYGPADYTDDSQTVRWLKMHIKSICDRMVHEKEVALQKITGEAPVHIH